MGYEYFLGVINAAYREFEQRTHRLGGRGSKRALIERFIASSISNEFTIGDVRRASPAASDSYIKKVLGGLKAAGVIEPQGVGRSAKWKRRRSDFRE